MRAIATILLLMLPAEALAQSTLSKREVRTLPNAQVKKRIVGQIGELLTLGDQRREVPATQQLRSLALRSKSHATRYAGLCTTDLLLLDYAAVANDLGADTRSAMTGMTVRRYFHFLTPPAKAEAVDTFEARWPGAGRCADIDFNEAEYFAAEDPETATIGYWAKERALAALAAGTVTDPPCEKFYDEESRDCASVIAEVARGPVSGISECSQVKAIAWGMPCYLIVFAWNRELRVGLRGETVARIELEAPIISIHERID